MKRITLLCTALVAGALAAPAMAQSMSGIAGVPPSAQAAPTPNQTESNAQTSIAAQNAMNQQGLPAGQPSSSQSASAGQDTSTQVAMNNVGSGSASAASGPTDLSSVPDNRHRYSRARRAADNRSEAQTTRELNQKETSATANSQAQ